MPKPTFQIAFTQMCASTKTYSEDALCNGVEIHGAKNRKTRLVEYGQFPIRLAVADGVFDSPQPHLASRFWAERWLEQGANHSLFFQQGFDSFLDCVPFASSTTFVGVVLEETGKFGVCNIGDSRAYLISQDGKWTQISHDHSLINGMIERGEAQAGVEYSNIYNVLEHCIIADPMEDLFWKHIYYHQHCLQAGESLLLCSDGLTDALPHEQLEQIWNDPKNQKDLPKRLSQLKTAVKRTDYYDDCSIVCVQAQ